MSFLLYQFSRYLPQNNALTIAVSLVIFSFITGVVVWQAALRVSSDFDKAEQEKNRALQTLGISEEALRETNEYLNNLFNYANAPIITWDPGFRITRFNHAFEHLAGRTQGEVIGEKA